MKKLSLASFAVAAVVLSTSAFAGYKLAVPVSVTSTSFTGSYGSARNSSDSYQWLFCRDNGTSAYCGARDSAGTAKSCTTTNPDHLNIIRSMVDTSRIGVTFNSSGTCTSLYQVNGSYYETLLP